MKTKSSFVEITNEGKVISPEGASIGKILFCFFKKRIFIFLISFMLFSLVFSFFQNNEKTEIKFILLFMVFIFVLIYKFLNKKPISK